MPVSPTLTSLLISLKTYQDGNPPPYGSSRCQTMLIKSDNSSRGSNKISWCSVPHRCATCRARPISFQHCSSSPTKPREYVLIFGYPISANSPTIVEESSPPDRAHAMGTSLSVQRLTA